MWGFRRSSVQGLRCAGETEEDFHENNQEYAQDFNHNLLVYFIMGIYVKSWLANLILLLLSRNNQQDATS